MDVKHCGKSRNCSLLAIPPFPTMFLKDLYCRHVKTGLVWERVNQARHYLVKDPPDSFVSCYCSLTPFLQCMSYRVDQRRISMFPGFLTPVPTQFFFPKPPTTFLRCRPSEVKGIKP